MALILALRRQKQAAFCEIEGSLVSIVSSRPAMATGRPCLRQTNNCFQVEAIELYHVVRTLDEVHPCEQNSVLLVAACRSRMFQVPRMARAPSPQSGSEQRNPKSGKLSG